MNNGLSRVVVVRQKARSCQLSKHWHWPRGGSNLKCPLFELRHRPLAVGQLPLQYNVAPVATAIKNNLADAFGFRVRTSWTGNR